MGRDERPWERPAFEPDVIEDHAAEALALVFTLIFFACFLTIGGIEGVVVGSVLGIVAIVAGNVLLMRSARGRRQEHLPPLESITIDRMLERQSGEILLVVDPPDGVEWQDDEVGVLEGRLTDYLTFVTTKQIVHHLGRKAEKRPIIVAVASREPKAGPVRDALRRNERVYEGSGVPLMLLDGRLRRLP